MTQTTNIENFVISVKWPHMIREYRLGRSIALLVPFYRRIKQQEFITNKLLIIMGTVAIVKVVVLLML
jgi:hypothetical protein